ncbi:MAG TPA: hypothetical protein VE177_03430 [Candidatus Binatus sp.]|nr:hypothetical protein [Candidatus Binatus sp.]
MRASSVTTFYETLDYCFDKVLCDILGKEVQTSVYQLLERNRISRKDVSNRFDDVVSVMTKFLGTSSRVVIQRTVVEMFKQYSQRVTFSYSDSLKDQLEVLKGSVTANHLAPKRLWENISFDSLEQLHDGPKSPEESTSGPFSQGYNSFYRTKKGISSSVSDPS